MDEVTGIYLNRPFVHKVTLARNGSGYEVLESERLHQDDFPDLNPSAPVVAVFGMNAVTVDDFDCDLEGALAELDERGRQMDRPWYSRALGEKTRVVRVNSSFEPSRQLEAARIKPAMLTGSADALDVYLYTKYGPSTGWIREMLPGGVFARYTHTVVWSGEGVAEVSEGSQERIIERFLGVNVSNNPIRYGDHNLVGLLGKIKRDGGPSRRKLRVSQDEAVAHGAALMLLEEMTREGRGL